MKGPPRVKFVQYPILSRCPVCGAPVYKGSKKFCKPSHEAKFNREKHRVNTSAPSSQFSGAKGNAGPQAENWE
jgi:hypothetical protein